MVTRWVGGRFGWWVDDCWAGVGMFEVFRPNCKKNGAAIGRRWRVCPGGFCFNSGGGGDAEIPQGRDESFINIELYISLSPHLPS